MVGLRVRIKACLCVVGAIAALTLSGPGQAQSGNVSQIPSVTASGSAGEWSGHSGRSGDPRMTVESIRSAAKDFSKCIEGLRVLADGRGISREGFDAATMGLKPDLELLDRLDSQLEHKVAVWEYLDVFLSKERIDRGHDMISRYRAVLDTIEKTYGVDRNVLVAIWGIETNYGTEMGRWPVLQSTATLACIGRRQKYFRGEFLAALSLLARGDISPGGLFGTWSGAFGHTNFMPSSVEAFAVDFDRSGRLDIVASVPNALASTANFLKSHGWMAGPLSVEVTLPKSFDYAMSERLEPSTGAEWSALGVLGVDGKPVANTSDRGWLFLPEGADGPSLLIFQNFRSILSYNQSYSYALAVMLLSDRLRGGDGLRHDWPRSDRILSDTERLELQARLVRRGFNIGRAPDGSVTAGTRAAIRRFQTSVGMVADGFPSRAVYERLVAP